MVLRTVVGVVGHCDDAHGLPLDALAQPLEGAAVVLVGPQHGPQHPVRPVDEVPVHRDPKRVLRDGRHYHLGNTQTK